MRAHVAFNGILKHTTLEAAMERKTRTNKPALFKMLHMSDLHLGKSLKSHDLEEDQAHVLAQIVQTAERVQPDAVLICGDIFDRSIPTEGAQSLFGRFMADLRRALSPQAHILVIPGNHDSARRVAYASELFESVGIHLVSRIGLEPALVLEKEERRAAFWAIPFPTFGAYHEFRRSAALAEAEAGTGSALPARMAEVLGRIDGRLEAYDINIGLAHCFVRGAALTESDSAFIGGTEAVPPDLFSSFDYVALGHLHRMQELSPRMWYSGAPLPMSFGDRDRKGVLLVELKVNGEEDEREIRPKMLHEVRVEVRPLLLEPLHRFCRIRGSFDDLMARGIEESPPVQDYIEALLTDAMMVPNAMERLRTVYPNILGIRYEAFENAQGFLQESGIHQGETADPALRQAHSIRDDFSAFASFVFDGKLPEGLMDDFDALCSRPEEEP